MSDAAFSPGRTGLHDRFDSLALERLQELNLLLQGCKGRGTGFKVQLWRFTHCGCGTLMCGPRLGWGPCTQVVLVESRTHPREMDRGMIHEVWEEETDGLRQKGIGIEETERTHYGGEGGGRTGLPDLHSGSQRHGTRYSRMSPWHCPRQRATRNPLGMGLGERVRTAPRTKGKL